jgi:hypothetical protein
VSALKRLNRKALLDFVNDRINAPVPGLPDMRSEVVRSIYAGLRERIERGEFDYPDQPMNKITGRFEPYAEAFTRAHDDTRT